MGGSLVSVPMAIVLQLMCDRYHWSGALVIIAGLMLNSVPMGMLYTHVIRHLPPGLSTALKRSKRKKIIDLSLLKNASFVLYVVSCGFHMAAMVTFSIYLIRFAQSMGVESTKAASLSSTLGFIDVSLRPLVGYLVSRKRICGRRLDRGGFLAVFMALQALCCLLTAVFAHDFVSLLGFTIVYALTIGVVGSLPVTVLAEMFGSENLASSLGLRYFVLGVFSMSFPPLVGAFVDASSSHGGAAADGEGAARVFRLPFYCCAAWTFVAFLLLVLVQWLERRRRRRVKAAAVEPTA